MEVYESVERSVSTRYVPADVAERPADAAPTQVVTGRYVPLTRDYGFLILVDTQTGRAWREVLVDKSQGSQGTVLERFLQKEPGGNLK